MKRIFTILMAAALLLSLTACGSKKPSVEEVQQAIESGSMTLEDALAKGYVTQEWAEDYVNARSVPMTSKSEAGRIGDFSTTTLSGDPYTLADLNAVTFFVFLDPADAGAEEFYANLAQVYPDVQAAGAEITLCLKSEENQAAFENAPFPVILYNDSLKEAISSHLGMIEGIPNTGSWVVNGSFLSAWYSQVDVTDFAESAAAFVEMSKAPAPSGDDAAAMGVLG